MCWVVKTATLSKTESIVLDFSPVIINILRIALLDTNFGLYLPGFHGTKIASFLEFAFRLRVHVK